jgi:hypothetical protein
MFCSSVTLSAIARSISLGAMRKSRTMDIERINLIGTLLADLSTRTEQLRRYL